MFHRAGILNLRDSLAADKTPFQRLFCYVLSLRQIVKVLKKKGILLPLPSSTIAGIRAPQTRQRYGCSDAAKIQFILKTEINVVKKIKIKSEIILFYVNLRLE